jgi:gamma-glutamyltranspeptidase / glutathione hydrolase
LLEREASASGFADASVFIACRARSGHRLKDVEFMRSFHFPGRSAVYARHAMCATSHPSATVTALDVLRQGGNAVDAAIATAAVLAVVECPMTGIGGDCFALVAKPGAKAPLALNAAGRAPAAAHAAWYAREGIQRIETTSVHAVTVPGAVDGWCRLCEDHGSMPLARLLGPAIELAEQGFVVAPRVSVDWARAAAKLGRHPSAAKHFLPAGRAPRVGEVVRFPALAATLKRIAKEGRAGFYAGEAAQDMVRTLKDLGGLHTLEDFAGQSASYVEPISTRYHDIDLYELPPSNHGVVALILLKMLQRLGRVGASVSVERYHVLMEAARLAFAMRDSFVADPDAAHVPLGHLMDDRVIDGLLERIDRRRRRPDLGPVPRPSGSDTVCFSIVDAEGMAVSFINSLFADFGSGIAADGTGVVFHNRGEGFVLDPSHPNGIAPRKRPLHTLIPAMGFKAGELALSFGVMGAHFQPMGHVYVMSNLFDYGMDLQEAVDCPRVFFEGDGLLIEDAVPGPVVAGLEALGHKVKRRELPWGGAQIIARDAERGVLIGASDHRKDGMALGY